MSFRNRVANAALRVGTGLAMVPIAVGVLVFVVINWAAEERR